MHDTSALWKQILAEPDHVKEIKVTINGTEYPPEADRLIRASIVGKLFDAPGVGNAFSRTLDLEVVPYDGAQGKIPAMSEIRLYVRLVSADGQRVSEYIPKGVFYADTAKRDSDTDAVTVTAFDAMSKMGTPFGASASGGGGGEGSRAYTISFSDTFGHIQKFLRRAGDPMPTPDAPTREGERFIGWRPDPEDTPTVTGDAHFRAQWAAKHLVTFDAGDGTPQEFTVFEDDPTPTPETPTREGYVFTGWKPTPKPTVTRKITYTAQWEMALPSIVSVAITSYPAKTDYTIGETLNYTGLAVTATLSDDTELDITSSCEALPPNGAQVTEAGDIMVDIRYDGASVGTFWISAHSFISLTAPVVPVFSDGTPEVGWLRANGHYYGESPLGYYRAFSAQPISAAPFYDGGGINLIFFFSKPASVYTLCYSYGKFAYYDTSDSVAYTTQSGKTAHYLVYGTQNWAGKYEPSDYPAFGNLQSAIHAFIGEMPAAAKSALRASSQRSGSAASSWPRTARSVMQEIAERIGAPLDPRTSIGADDIEDTALGMTMRQVAGYVAAMNGGNWTITDEGRLYLAPLGMAAQVLADESGAPLLFGEAALSV